MPPPIFTLSSQPRRTHLLCPGGIQLQQFGKYGVRRMTLCENWGGASRKLLLGICRNVLILPNTPLLNVQANSLIFSHGRSKTSIAMIQIPCSLYELHILRLFPIPGDLIVPLLPNALRDISPRPAVDTHQACCRQCVQERQLPSHHFEASKSSPDPN